MGREQETRRVARLLEIIWLIQAAPRYWTRQRLAERFEVSVRSITSDIQVIRHRLAWDVRTERGSGYHFHGPVPRLPSVNYSVPEALALILAAQAGMNYGGVPQEELGSAIRRLTSVFPEDLRRFIEQSGVTPASPADDRRTALLSTAASAISRSHCLALTYRVASRGGEETERVIDPLAILPYDKSWQLVGYCHLRQAVRVFKIDRIKKLDILPQRFNRPAGFDLGQFLASGWGIMRGLDAPVDDVTLLFRPPASEWVAEGEWHEGEIIERQPDGSIIYRASIQVTPEFQRWVLRYGRMVDIIAPSHLRDWLVDEARAILDRAETA